jgi:hypothetical protein
MVITEYSEDHREDMNTPCRQNAKFFNVGASGMYSYDCDRSGYDVIMNCANEPAASHPYDHKEILVVVTEMDRNRSPAHRSEN